ncbi:MAG: flagellar biosynthesis protein FlhB [Candidatus Manganitrophaceae bacterium]|nr:MAG: flagellar biosynthesis protein FlhB [Candidatus Manganitrophaceae bacterium]
MAEDQERSEQATPKRREEARKKGQVPRSREIHSAALILGGVFGFSMMGPMVVSEMKKIMVQTLGGLSSAPMTEAAFYQLAIAHFSRTLLVIVPVMGILGAISIAVSFGQHGWVWSTGALAPDWSRINPLKGLQKFFSMQAAAELIKTVIKFLAVGGLSYLLIRRAIPTITVAIQSEPSEMTALVGNSVYRLALATGFLIAFLGAADYLFQWWSLEKSLRMSRQEMKEEMRQSEGDPMVRARVRSVQKEMARKRMMADVPKADVVLTNPTTLAVALVYQHGKMNAPKVVAKGAGFIAERIREIARQHGVPVIENKPLARALFKTVKVGDPVPSKLYRAVAEILAYVYRLKAKTR